MPTPVSVSAERIARCRVLVVGDAMLDRYWHGEVERLSPEAPVPIVRVRGTDARLGGAANVARNVVALGAKAGLLTALGTDEPAEVIRRLLKEAGIEDHAAVSPGLGTTVKLRVIGRRQQMLRVDFESEPDSDVLAGQIGLFRELLQKFDLVLLSDYGKGGLKHIEQIIGVARAANKPVLVDPKGDEYSRYAGATIITPNRAELREVVGRWTDETDLQRRAQELRKSLDLQALLLTRSEEGMTLFTEQGAWSVAAATREVFDVTGAGDTVIAVLAVMMAAGVSLRDAVTIANKAGGIVVGKLGTSTASYSELFKSNE
jgi:D-glycero-beta-D-manno-heptose-7-phosphate kinase